MSSTTMERFLTCIDCKEYFDGDLHAPHVLPCLHTCCTQCLKSRISKNEVHCPECLEKFEAAHNDVSGFPVDSARKYIVDCYRIQKKNEEYLCDECGISSIKELATSRCKECDEFLCEKCTDAHQRTKLTRRHQLVSSEKLKNSPLEEFPNKQTCAVEGHEGQPFSFYCTSSGCDRPVCSVCVVTNHQQNGGHEVRDINEVYVEKKRLVEGQLLDIKHRKTSVDEAIEQIEDGIQSLYLNESSMDEEIEAQFSACIKILEKRKEELKEKLATVSQEKKKDLEGRQDRLTKQKGQLDQACKFTDDLLQYSNAAEFLLMKDQVLNRMATLKNQPVDVFPANSLTETKFQATNMGDDFVNFCQNMGSVCVGMSSGFLPNTRVQVHDIVVGKEQSPLLITLNDNHSRPLSEADLDIKVEILNSKNQRGPAVVLDKTRSQGCYKVVFTAPKPGEYRALVKIMGILLEPEGYVFKAKRIDEMGSENSLAYLTATEKKEAKDAIDSDGQEIKYGAHEIEKLNLQAIATSRGKPLASREFKTVGEILCPDLNLDPLAVHPQNEVQENLKTMNNQKSRHRTPRNLSQAFQNFRGTIGNRSMGRIGRYYFEVNVSFFVKRSLRQDLIFEIGLCRKSDVDKHYTIDNHPFSYVVCARKCHICQTICLQGWNNGQRFFHSPITENSPPGTSFKSTYGFLLDARQRQWVVLDAKNRRFILRFKNIDMNKPLWPVFGLYNPDLVNSSLTVRSGKDISSILEVPFDF